MKSHSLFGQSAAWMLPYTHIIEEIELSHAIPLPDHESTFQNRLSTTSVEERKGIGPWIEIGFHTNAALSGEETVETV